MADSIDPRWPKVLSHSVHEFRTPLTVASGYVRMLLTGRAGEITDPQRRLLDEAAKGYARLSALVAEMSELSNIEAGKLTYNWQPTDARAAIRTAAAQLPPLPDRDVAIDLQLADAPAMVNGDRERLVQAFTAVLGALRREIVTDDPLSVRETSGADGTFEVHIGDGAALAALASGEEGLVFYEWRGGVGLSLTIARRLIELHGGRIVAPPGDRVDEPGDGIVEPRGGRKAGVAITLPLS